MNCSYNSSSGMINCLENFTTSDEINNFDSEGYTQFQDTANLVGYIIDSDLYSNSDKNVQIMALIDNKIRSKKTKSTDIRTVPVNDMIDEELHNKNVFYMTIFGDSLKDNNKEIKLKIKYNSKIYEISSDKNLLFKKNNRFSSNLLTPVKFTVLTDNIDYVDDTSTETDKIVDEQQRKLEKVGESIDEKVEIKKVETEKVEADELKLCLSSFLECNEESDIMQAKCLDDFLQCNKDGTLDQCTEEFVSCNKI
jgi:hypothetical protein